jgi:hypothetical protein
VKSTEELLSLCHRPSDYSLDFVERVRSVAEALTPCLPFPPYHRTSMDYTASTTLSYWFDAEFNGVAWADAKGAYRLDFLFSSKADLYTIMPYSSAKMTLPVTWVPDATVMTTGPLAEAIRCAAALLGELGWEYVEEGELRRPADAFLTEMDGVQASLFEVLFSELS